MEAEEAESYGVRGAAEALFGAEVDEEDPAEAEVEAEVEEIPGAMTPSLVVRCGGGESPRHIIFFRNQLTVPFVLGLAGIVYFS